jgi:hypothetical protein
MKQLIPAGFLFAFFLGCSSAPPGEERGPDGTIAYYIQVESSAPARIEANNDYIGDTPARLRVFADRDGTFHNFGSSDYVIRAFPKTAETNAFPQTKIFRTGGWFSQEDKVPSRIYFDMSQKGSGFTVDLPRY